MKTYVVKIGAVYLRSGGSWGTSQKDALRIDAPCASDMRIVRLKLRPIVADDAYADSYAGF